MLDNFKKFILRGNVIDLAVGVIIGASFGAITASLVADIITPSIGLIFGKPDFSALVIAAGENGEGGIMIGKFVNALINFILVAFAVYFFVVVPVNKLNERFMKKDEPSEEPIVPTTVLTKEQELLGEIRDLLKEKELR